MLGDKEAVKSLKSLRRQYIIDINRIKADLKDYHKAAFEKFVFLFHKTITDILRVQSNLTIDELIDSMKSLTSAIYQISKDIKKKEDELLQIKDKKAFQHLRKEIQQLHIDKRYMVLVEKNISKHNLVFLFEDISERINKMGFSGEKTEREEAAAVISKSDQFILGLTAVEEQDLGMMSMIMNKLFTSSKSTSGKSKGRPAKEPSLQLSSQEKEYIKNYVKFRAGPNHYDQYSTRIITYIEHLEDGRNLDSVADIFKKNGWPPQFVEPTINSIKRVLQHRK